MRKDHRYGFVIQKYQNLLLIVFMVGLGFCFWTVAHAANKEDIKTSKAVVHAPKLREKAILTFAPDVPPPITRKKPALVTVNLNSSRVTMKAKGDKEYEFWTFNDHVPGPFIRVRVGDMLEVHHTSKDDMGMPHNVDLHAVTGPGGGAPVTTVVKGDERVAWFKMLHPGLYVYHCAAPPVMDHVANGMWGLILVEPEGGLPKVDREFYVMQSEIYARFADGSKPKEAPPGHNMPMKGEEHKAEESVWGDEVADQPESNKLIFSHQDGLDEHPMFVVFNGKVGSLTNDGVLKAKVGEKVRIFFGNAGPNLISSFHVIGTIFEDVYREGDLVSTPGHSIQTSLVPPGGSTVVDFKLEVPGSYTLVDHAIFRVEKGAAGFLQAEGKPNYDIYASDQDPVLCPGCLVHP